MTTISFTPGLKEPALRAMEVLAPDSAWIISGNQVQWQDPVNPPPTQAELDAKILEMTATLMTEAKMDAKRRVAEFADQIAEQITGAVPQAERDSWTAKENAARSYLANTATTEQLSILTAEASVTEETLIDLSNKILANVTVYMTAAGMIAGQRRKTMAAIEALNNPATLEQDLQAILDVAQAEAGALLQQILGG